MKDTICKREYNCQCKRVTTDYVWESQLAQYKLKCFKCGKELGIKNLKVKEVVQSPSIRTPTKNR